MFDEPLTWERQKNREGFWFWWVPKIWMDTDLYIKGTPAEGYTILERHVPVSKPFAKLREAKVAYMLRSVS